MIKCPNCQAEMPETMKFCGNCGKALAVQELKCPKCGAKVEPGMQFCGNCGQKMG